MVTKNYAQEGGVIFIADTSNTTIVNTTFKSNTASKKGGFMSVQNPNSGNKGNITIDSCKIDDIKAVSGIQAGIGGAFHFDTIRISNVTINNVTVNNAQAELDGGVFYIDKMKGFISLTKSTFIDFKVSAAYLGSFFYSGYESEVQLSISHSNFKCSSVYTDLEADAAVVSKTAMRAGAIYMKGSKYGLVSDTVSYSYCY